MTPPVALEPPIVLTPPRTLPRSRPPLTLGYPALDAWDLARPGRLAFLDGPPDRAFYRLAASATLAGDVLVVDGGNRFDAFRLVDAATALRIDANETLTRTWVARAFTPYQMQALLEETAPDRLASGRVRTLLVVGVAEQYADQDTPRREGDVLYRRALRVLRETAHGSEAVVVATNHSSAMHRRRGFVEAALAAADESAQFLARERGGSVVVRLPNRGVTFLAQPDGALERPLTAWA